MSSFADTASSAVLVAASLARDTSRSAISIVIAAGLAYPSWARALVGLVIVGLFISSGHAVYDLICAIHQGSTLRPIAPTHMTDRRGRSRFALVANQRAAWQWTSLFVSALSITGVILGLIEGPLAVALISTQVLHAVMTAALVFGLALFTLAPPTSASSSTAVSAFTGNILLLAATLLSLALLASNLAIALIPSVAFGQSIAAALDAFAHSSLATDLLAAPSITHLGFADMTALHTAVRDALRRVLAADQLVAGGRVIAIALVTALLVGVETVVFRRSGALLRFISAGPRPSRMGVDSVQRLPSLRFDTADEKASEPATDEPWRAMDRLSYHLPSPQVGAKPWPEDVALVRNGFVKTSKVPFAPASAFLRPKPLDESSADNLTQPARLSNGLRRFSLRSSASRRSRATIGDQPSAETLRGRRWTRLVETMALVGALLVWLVTEAMLAAFGTDIANDHTLSSLALVVPHAEVAAIIAIGQLISARRSRAVRKDRATVSRQPTIESFDEKASMTGYAV